MASLPPPPPMQAGHCLQVSHPHAQPMGKDVPNLLPTEAAPTGRGGHQDSVLLDRECNSKQEDQNRPGAGFQGQLQPRDHQASPAQSKMSEKKDQQGAWPDTGIPTAELRHRPRVSI